MGKKIIDSHRYKKVPRNKIKKNNKKLKTKKVTKAKRNVAKRNVNIFANSVSNTRSNYGRIIDNTLKEEKKEKVKEKIKSGVQYSKFVKIAICILAIFSIFVISKLVLSKNGENILSVFSNDNNSNEELEDNYNFKIGISKLDTTDYLKSSNVILNELATKTFYTLVKVNKDYKIEYSLAEKIEKISDTSYKIYLNPIYKVTSDDVITSFNKIKLNQKDSIYYSKISNIDKMIKEDDSVINVSLLSPDPFFVYSLVFPINDSSNKSTEYIMNDVSLNSVSLVKNSSKSSLGVISLTNYENTDDMVDNFRNGNIDMFTASSDSIMQLIGKREYNVKKYRDGETVFLLGNKDSALYKKKEVRQAIAYAINRDEIVKNIDMKFSEVIDIPYIYSDVKYKYDLYAAENALLINGWKKTSGIYTKKDGYEYQKIELNLLVNKDDTVKSNIADSIKEMVEKVGIRINVLKLSENEIIEKVNAKDYDIVLSTIYINDSPNIEYLYDYINVNDITNSAIENVKNSDVSNIEENVQTLKNAISSEVSCIGIMAKTTNVVYQKYIKGFDNISYLKVFDNIENIGRVKE